MSPLKTLSSARLANGGIGDWFWPTECIDRMPSWRKLLIKDGRKALG